MPTPDDYCPKSDLPVHSCAHCRSQTPEPHTTAQPFVARYHGTCGGCGFDIRPDELVQYQPSTAGGSTIAHVRCAHG